MQTKQPTTRTQWCFKHAEEHNNHTARSISCGPSQNNQLLDPTLSCEHYKFSDMKERYVKQPEEISQEFIQKILSRLEELDGAQQDIFFNSFLDNL